MILPIIGYGHPILKKKAEDISADYPKLKQLIADMYETMYNAEGVGLAAPQIGKSIRLFVVDATPFSEEDEDGVEDNPELEGFKKTFINARIIEEEGDEWSMREGCLSIPEVREEVVRKPSIRIQWLDENFKAHDERFEGFAARVIQHEYDHIEGILFTDKIQPLRRTILKGKLANIAKGKVDAHYKMKFFTKRSKR